MVDSEHTDEQLEVRSLAYEPNPKHKPIPIPGRHGSICPSSANGPRLLFQSDLVGNKRYATDGENVYCAQQHALAGGTGTRSAGTKYPRDSSLSG